MMSTIYSAGRPVERRSDGRSSEQHASLTCVRLATPAPSTPEDVDEAYRRARAAQRSWAQVPPARRAGPFVRLHDVLLSSRAEILDIVQYETGKTHRHAFEEVLDAAAVALYYARRAPRLLAPRRRSGAFPVLTRAWEVRQPKGVVAAITPWNCPLALPVTDIVPALLAGNAVVHKPDSQTVSTTLWVRERLREAGLPTDLWQVVTGEPELIGDPLIDRADYICFTGSTESGQRIAARAAQRLIGCSLELGGKNAMLVLPDADPATAARGAIRACFSNAGQLCLSIERIYVVAALYDVFVDHLVRLAADMRLGAGPDRRADMGPLTLPRQLATVNRHVDTAVRSGATVLTGGRARPDLGPLFYEPTVLADVTPDMQVYHEETFGPVVSVYRVADEAEAVRRANDTPYGLNASIWTRDPARGRRVGRQLRAGTVNINEGYAAAYGSHDAPMGGMLQSGLGRRHGAEGLLKYTEAQTIAAQHLLGFDTALGAPLSDALLSAVFRAMRHTRLR